MLSWFRFYPRAPKAVALLSLASYLLVAVCAAGWHRHDTACGSRCAASCESEEESCCDRTEPRDDSHPHAARHGDDKHESDAPIRGENDCSVCQVLAAKPLPPPTVTLAVLTEPVAEILRAVAPRLDRPLTAVCQPRGPPEHA